MSQGPGLRGLSSVRLALMAQEARAQAAPILRADPIAIVGMACRTPGGGQTPDDLWRLLAAGETTTRDIPADRFDAAPWHDPDPAAPGKFATTRGSFLDQIDQFDPEYFGLPPREVEQMDPQQRLALETAVEAIDDAGASHAGLKGSRSGVFMACYHSDYARLVYENVDSLDTRSLTGTLHGVVANRISHFLDLRGPSLTLDTGCSSSLVAIHLACQSLRLGETDFALAGGVSVMITPELFVALSKVGFMSPDGQCKTFDASADGFGRGEGCGMVALKRLSDAVADGDRVLAVIRGSAINQDGRSTVLTAPNGKAQEAMLREALEAAALPPERISFVEAHGTGTSLGDPIEVEALSAVLGSAGDEPCYVGSLKANIGHLEAGAGVVGLIKAVQVLHHGQVPAQPNFQTLSPHISLAGSRLKVPTALTDLPRTGQPLCAAVSSFGVGGTNAHVVLEEAPALPGPDAAEDGAIWTLPLSARTPEGLRDLAQAWIARLDGDDAIGDLCFTASERRDAYPVRLAVSGRTKAELQSRLAAALEQGVPTAPGARPRVGFVFSGQGPQWWAMGRELLDAEPVFRAAMQACDAAIAKAAGWSVIDELGKSEAHSRMAETRIAQPALFALQTALTALWASWGVTPAAVAGHSVGEIAALHAAGVLSLEEAARIVVLRGAIMQAATGGGAMAAVDLTEAEALAVAAEHEGRLDLAAINATRSTVLSGEKAALDAAVASLAARGVSARALQVDYAFHSSQMTALASRFGEDLGAVAAATPATPIYSTLTGARLEAQVDAAYLADAIRKPVRFAAAIAAMRQTGVDVFLEIGPHPALTAAIAETLEASPPRAIAASLRRGRDETETMRNALAALYGAGLDPRWDAVQPAEGSVVTLPAYPWRRRRLWVSPRRSDPARSAASGWLGLPAPVAGAGLTIVPVDPRAIADWLGDHVIFDQVLLPGAAMIQAMANAAAQATNGRLASLADVVIRQPLPFESEADLWQVVVSDGGDVSFHARAAGEADWRRIAEARAVPATEPAAFERLDGGAAADIAGFYDHMADHGVDFGSAFRLLSAATSTSDQAEATAVLPGHLPPGFALHPALIDAGIQLVSLICDSDGAFLPLSVDRVWLGARPSASLRLSVRIVSRSDASLSADLRAWSEDGALAVALDGLNLVRAEPQAFAGKPAEIHEIDWVPVAASETLAPDWLILDDAGDVGAALADELAAAGVRALRPDATSSLQDSLAAGSADAAIVCLWPLGAERGSAVYARALGLLHALAERGPRAVILATQGASGVDAAESDEGLAMQGAGLAALAGVAALEHPDLRVRAIDLDPLATPQAQAQALLRALRTPEAPLVAARGEEIRSPRLRLAQPSLQGAVRVVQTGEGLDGVALRPATPSDPGPGELRLAIRAAGLNFRDTLVALGAYPGTPPPFGAECAGVVEAVGSGVEGFAVGDRVVALAGASLGSHVIVRADLTAAMPRGMTFETAAAAPVAFLTADIGLHRLADMQAGDRVLIHAATGGVGLAALALAQRAGAEVFATAGSPEKRAYLRGRGVRHVFDSRNLDFADQVLAATEGAGVRIALNSLTGKFVGATLRALAKDGVLLELGKREIWTPQEVAAERPDVAYHVFDAGQMAQADPSLFQDCAADVLPALALGDLARLPLEVRPLAAAQDALRRMAQARHMGKLVLTVPSSAGETVPVDPAAAYLITGGFGGVGLASARWLVGKGARQIVLVGRSAPNAAASSAVAALEAQGAKVRAVQADLADLNAMRVLLAEVVSHAPLRGIIHAAGAPANGLIRDLNAAAVAEAGRGKVEGARVLRTLTQGMALDFVVLCSAAGPTFGAPGQGAYAAANAELEALARQWRREGAPVSTIAWGPWAEAGMFAAMSERAQGAWSGRGLAPMSDAEALSAMERVLAADLPHALVARVDWKRALADEATRRNVDLFTGFAAKTVRADAPAPAANDGLAQLRALPPALRRAALVEAIARRVRAVLDLTDETVLPPATPMKDLGLDSLMAVELRNHLARFGGQPLPATLAFDYPTLDALADRLGEVWSLTAPTPAQGLAPTSPPTPASAGDDLADLSEKDLEALLAAELDQYASASS